MKTLLFIFSVLIGVNTAFSQLPELLSSGWHIDYIVVDGVTYDGPFVNSQGIVHPNIIFETTFASAVIDPDSDSFGSMVDYNANDAEFTFVNPSMTLPGCMQHCFFAGHYFSLLTRGGTDPVHFNYDIVDNTGDLTLTLTDDAGDIAVYQDAPILGINELQNIAISIYPNPVLESLFIAAEGEEIETISVYTISGKRIISETLTTNQIDVSALKAGLYFIEMTTFEGKSILKFIKI